MIAGERKYLKLERIVSWLAFAILLTTYWCTVAPTVSFWDCPEYVSAAYLLEVGHPPGNPTWMLVERMVTLLVPGRYAALAVNLSSGLFTAFAAFFLAKTIFRVGLWVLLKLPRRNIPAPLAAAGGAFAGALAFGWCDSAWYSAVEAEVYAMSIFMTSLCVWLMTKWAGTRSRPESWRLLILIAYLFGLSIGVHQLNLLCIPALAMIWAVRRGIRSTGRLLAILLLSFVAVACVLLCMMPGTISLASRFELFAVNMLGLPALSGVVIYILLLGASLILALVATRRCGDRKRMGAACFPAIFLSGIFVLSDRFLIGALLSAIVSALLVSGVNFQARRLFLAIWMLAMLLTGYATYALIPVRGNIPSPANASMPGEPFAFASYLSREQYGSKPLAYGPTPYSKMMLREEYDSTGKAYYSRFMFDYGHAVMRASEPGARLRPHAPGLTESDSVDNARLLQRGGASYIAIGCRPDPVKTPELNMWFPRITSQDPNDIISYGQWIGMDTSSMRRVRVSEAIDSAGRAVAKAGSDGERRPAYGYRPTYVQNLQWLLSYQTGYMYWRYLLWNFAGRQNDRPSQGEVQHGNFITGIGAVDNAMLGAEDYLPAAAGADNPGRNVYWCLPLLLGLLGIGWLLKSRRRGIAVCAVTGVLFVMTGIAIVIYLNQDPGEPRERDYSFLGSFWAYCIWIGFGAVMIARRFRSVWGFALPLAVVAWMGFENLDDHDRSGRTAARDFAVNILESVGPQGILFVNGDNYTFPLWYAQEVEGVRRDVRVINLSYLSTPVYAANLMKQWRESAPVPTTLRRGDIIWGAYNLARIEEGVRDTLDATEALLALRMRDDAKMPARHVRLKVSADSTVIFDLANLRGKGKALDFSKLMTFDIIATNAACASPRPIYWVSVLGPGRRIGLAASCTPWLYGMRYGARGRHEADSLLYADAMRAAAPNGPGSEVYMDHTPASQVSAQRGAIVAAGRRLLDSGDAERAAALAVKADVWFGREKETFGNVVICDTTFSTRRELGLLLIDCANVLAARSRTRAHILELRARGHMHLREYEEGKEAWHRYMEHLPPRLRGKMAPTY